jgi:hypothetical protein
LEEVDEPPRHPWRQGPSGAAVLGVAVHGVGFEDPPAGHAAGGQLPGADEIPEAVLAHAGPFRSLIDPDLHDTTSLA